MSDLPEKYWAEVAERTALMHGTKEQRLEYQTKVFPVEESLATRLDENDPSLIEDLVLIAEAAPNPDALAMFGAGSLSEALYNGGDSVIEQIAEQATKSESFHTALKAAFFGWEGLSKPAKKILSPLVEDD
ncbi:MAG: hypothetical protein ACYDCC_10985 [Actinomycetota bacterium]